jgi:hypothetical protein
VSTAWVAGVMRATAAGATSVADAVVTRCSRSRRRTGSDGEESATSRAPGGGGCHARPGEEDVGLYERNEWVNYSPHPIFRLSHPSAPQWAGWVTGWRTMHQLQCQFVTNFRCLGHPLEIALGRAKCGNIWSSTKSLLNQ